MPTRLSDSVPDRRRHGVQESRGDRLQKEVRSGRQAQLGRGWHQEKPEAARAPGPQDSDAQPTARTESVSVAARSRSFQAKPVPAPSRPFSDQELRPVSSLRGARTCCCSGLSGESCALCVLTRGSLPPPPPPRLLSVPAVPGGGGGPLLLLLRVRERSRQHCVTVFSISPLD